MNFLNKITFFTYLLTLLFSQDEVSGQTIAGSIPQGTSVLDSVLTLSIEGYEVDTIAGIDIDCDGTNDLNFKIYQGYPPGDQDNYAQLNILNGFYSICIDTSLHDAVRLHSFGDTLCSNDSQWSDESDLLLGCYGYNCGGLNQYYSSNNYIAFKNNSTQETGWIKFSMNLFSEKSPQPITLSISEMIVLCLSSSTKESMVNSEFIAFPNPTIGNSIKIECSQDLTAIHLLNSSGNIIKTYSGNTKEIILPEISGIYFISAINDGGKYIQKKIIKLE